MVQLYFYVADVNTLAPVMVHGKLIAGSYTAELDSILFMGLSQLAFYPPANTAYTLTVSASGYTTKTFTGITHADGAASVDIYVVPPPSPTPPPSGESIIGTVGTSCDLLSKSMFGRNWYSYRNRYTGAGWGWDSEYEDAVYAANGDPQCFVIPEAPPAPDAPGNVVDAISQKITASENTLSGKLTDIKNSIETRISDTLAGITNLTSIATDIRARLDVLAPIKKFTDEFKFPSWDAVIVQPINGLLQPLRDLKVDVGNFLKFEWFDALISKVEDAIDRRASALVGVDPAKPFWDGLAAKIDIRISQKFGIDPALPFFDALWQKIKHKLDVWFSGQFEIDPALPFWAELEKKIVALAIRSIEGILDAVIPAPPPRKVK